MDFKGLPTPPRVSDEPGPGEPWFQIQRDEGNGNVAVVAQSQKRIFIRVLCNMLDLHYGIRHVEVKLTYPLGCQPRQFIDAEYFGW